MFKEKTNKVLLLWAQVVATESISGLYYQDEAW